MRSYSRKRAALLAAVCLVLILGSVELMNLQVSTRTAMPAAAKNASSQLPAYSSGYRAARSEAPLDAGLSATNGSGASDHQPVSIVSSSDAEYLRSLGLQIPVTGVNSSELRDSFSDARGAGRRHEAIDIPAPRATPVVSAADGVVAKLFNSKLGGTTLYCFDKTGQFVFYYAHLSGYADGIAERKAIRKGEVLAYVGDTGDAGPGNFHLHFSISKASTPWKWYGGQSIDPYPLLGGKIVPASSK